MITDTQQFPGGPNRDQGLIVQGSNVELEEIPESLQSKCAALRTRAALLLTPEALPAESSSVPQARSAVCIKEENLALG